MVQRGMLEHLEGCRKAKALSAAEKRDKVQVRRWMKPHCCMSVTVSMELTVRSSEILRLKRNILSIDNDCSGFGLTCAMYVFQAAELLCFYLFCGYFPVTLWKGSGFLILQALVSFRKHHLIARVLIFCSEMLLRGRHRSSVAEGAALNCAA